MVNIHDVKTNKEDWAGDRLEAIFKRQRELMEKYHDIEARNGLLQTDKIPVNLHDRYGQARLKDFAWRATEEIGEALEARDRHPDIPDHCYEELADALHFLTEFTILAGITPKDIVKDIPGVPEDKDNLEKLFWASNMDLAELCVGGDPVPIEWFVGNFAKSMGMACNCLKNKPWKQTEMMTDVKEFHWWVYRAWQDFIQICDMAGLNTGRLTEYYFGKSEVNRFRQRSNY